MSAAKHEDRPAGFTPVQELMAEIRFGSYESSTEAARELDALIAAREAQAWDDGFDAGHQAARAVNPEWPALPTNPHRTEETP